MTVRETETPLISVHFPMEPEDMQKVLGERLEPDVYDGKAYIQVSQFYISKLEMFGVVPSLMSSWCMRISAYVKLKNSQPPGEKGYVILSADFDSSISGTIMTSGCKKSQLGTMCGTIAANQTEERDGKVFTVVQDKTLLLRLAAKQVPISNTAFLEWANQRYVRYQLSEDKKELRRGLQPENEKTFEGSYELEPFGIKPFISAVFQTKYAGYGWGYLDNITDPCERGRCVFYEKAVFLDENAETLSIVSNTVAGFQPLASGTRGANVWGSGTYFARDAKYVADGGFCGQPAADGTRQMLVCLLMTGVPCLGDPDHKGVLPFRNKPHRYNCSVDSLSSPEIFIVQHPGSALPAYLITFA
ncbi:PARP10 [Symbiodinium sp. CCMP2592]|nr:PARP10 [Symbiodinium sp. CCMP2592]